MNTVIPEKFQNTLTTPKEVLQRLIKLKQCSHHISCSGDRGWVNACACPLQILPKGCKALIKSKTLTLIHIGKINIQIPISAKLKIKTTAKRLLKEIIEIEKKLKYLEALK